MRKFGLLGYPLSHSFSQKYFSDKFQREGISDCSYENFSLPDLSRLPAILADPELCGLNVTIPYKEQVIPFLHEKNGIVSEIHACNCIRIRDGKPVGYNTDVIGFERSLLKKWGSGHTRALVLGTGGASKAVEYVLRKLGVDYRLVSRYPRPSTTDLSYIQVDADLLKTHTLLINTTPLGMAPNIEGYPPIPYEAIGPDHYLYDLVYNPERTLFLRKGEERGAVVENGHEMLLIQAEESWRIWNE